MVRLICIAAAAAILAACSALPTRDPLRIAVAGIEPLPGEGLEIRMAVSIRIQNPNDSPIDYSGAALDLDLNGTRLASGVSAASGSVPRYGETVLTIPVTISAFNVARQLMAFMNAPNPEAIVIDVNGKLDTGFLGARRFSDMASMRLPSRDLR
jgi:LEA14-like dessication related protein